MPLSITPATATHPEPVTLTNTLGYTVIAKPSVTDCQGHLVWTGPTETLLNGQTMTIPVKTGSDSYVTVSVERPATSGQLATAVALTSRQGCKVTQTTAKVAPLPVPSKATTSHAVAVTAPSGHSLPTMPIIGGGLGLIILGSGLVYLARPKRGQHHG